MRYQSAAQQQTSHLRMTLASGARHYRSVTNPPWSRHGSALIIICSTMCFALCPLLSRAIPGAGHKQQVYPEPGTPSAQSGGYIPPGMRAVPDPLYGVTVDDVSNISGIVASLSHFSHKPTTRIVFDNGQPPSAYVQAVNKIRPVSYILGMFADSTAMRYYSVPAYSHRVTDYLKAFGSKVDIWEIGNEINGEWLGSNVVTKMVNAYTLVKQAGRRTELTLYYNGLDDRSNCYANKDALMFRWAQANIPDTMKRGLDYVLISFYEQDCPGVSKDWQAIFTRLHQMFPNSRIGFGENGTREPTDPTSLKMQYMHEYYPLWVNVPCYVAGHFWWYFYEDGIPYTKNPLWTALNDDMNALVVPRPARCRSSPEQAPSATPSAASSQACAPSCAPPRQNVQWAMARTIHAIALISLRVLRSVWPRW